MLKPIETAERPLKSLNGIWRFRIDADARGRSEEWWRAPLREARDIAVPASYNDLFPAAAVRDHVGDAWYQTDLIVPAAWAGQRIVLRFDAATHRAVVWLDGTEIARHEGGYTPFEADISTLVQPGMRQRVTVCVNNELTWETIPPGRVLRGANGRLRQQVFHDFFNYAGLHRSVWLYATPQSHIADATVVTDYVPATSAGSVEWSVTVAGEGALRLTLIDTDGTVVASGEAKTLAGAASGRLTVAAATPWRPGRGHLYTLAIAYMTSSGVDRYSLPVGIRTVKVRDAQLLINDEPFYFTGFGKHEDSAVRGKGHDDALMIHDFALMDWMGANSFRTSHYPYAEDVLDYADRNGIVVIDETAAVGLNLSLGARLTGASDLPQEAFSPEALSARTQATHLQAIRELIARDKNHPSVVMWSIANEPDLKPKGALAYFLPLVEAVRSLDPTRPVTSVNVMFNGPEDDVLATHLDVLCLNRYFGWYLQSGDLGEAESVLDAELRVWAAKYGKPIVVTEYGADTMPGLHAAVPAMWTEEFQSEFLAMYHRVFDRIPEVIGEHVWNFADFATSQGVMRVGGNRKGVFSRDRQPKAAAFLLKERWTARAGAEAPPASKPAVTRRVLDEPTPLGAAAT
jgi:beta-glucuronidase